MIEHLVSFRARPGAEEALWSDLSDFAASIRGALPGLIELTVGKNFADRSRNEGFTHGLRARFETHEALQAYIAHPAHQKLISNFPNTNLGGVVVDYEVPSS